jgi:hypothetical protein
MSSPSGSRRAGVAVAAVVVVVLVAAAVVWGFSRSDSGQNATAATGASTTTGAPDTSAPGTPSGSGPAGTGSTSPQSLGTPTDPGTGGTVPDRPVRTRRAVPIGRPAHWVSGLSVRVVRLSPMHGKATGPGEVSGPAVRVELEVTNAARRPRSLDSSVVAAFYGPDLTPAPELSSGEHRLSGRIAARSSVHATYVFTVPVAQRDDLRIEVSLTPSAPTVAFHGAA